MESQLIPSKFLRLNRINIPPKSYVVKKCRVPANLSLNKVATKHRMIPKKQYLNIKL